MSTDLLRSQPPDAPAGTRELRHAGRREAVPAGLPRMLLSVNEAAAALGIGRTLMYELLGSGRIESVFVGRLHRVPADALDAFVEELRAECPAGRSTSGAASQLVPSHDRVQG